MRIEKIRIMYPDTKMTSQQVRIFNKINENIEIFELGFLIAWNDHEDKFGEITESKEQEFINWFILE